MTILLPAEPPGARPIVQSALQRRGHRAQHLPALGGWPQIGAPLPVYSLSRADAERPDPLADAHLTGWKYLILGGTETGAADLILGPNGLQWSGISHGLVPRRLLDAATFAEQQLQTRPERFEARILEIPSLRLIFLWLTGLPSYFVSLLDGRPAGSSQLALEVDLEPRILAARSRTP